MDYDVLLEREQDGGWCVSVPLLPGCYSQGDTREEALANIREAIELYLEEPDLVQGGLEMARVSVEA